MITETAFVKLTVLADMSWGATLMTYNMRGFGREVGSRDEPCAHSGELMIPTRVVDGWSVSRTDGDFNPRGGFGGYDDWTVRVARIREVTGIGSFSLFLLLCKGRDSHLCDPLGHLGHT